MTVNSNDNTYSRVGIFEGEDQMNVANSTWYVKKRRNITERWKGSTPLVDDIVVHTSPSGKYKLRVTPCVFDLHRNWLYAVGDVFTRRDGEPVQLAQVVRDHHTFPFMFCEDHPDGNDYLLCGEDYQGLTVIRLNTGERIDYIEKEAESNGGFSWRDCQISPDKTRIAMEGGYWAAGFEIHLRDFRNPFDVPYVRVGKDFVDYHDRLIGWKGNDHILIEREQEYRTSDGVLLNSVSQEERFEAIGTEGGTRNKNVVLSIGMDGRFEEVYSEWCPSESSKGRRKK